MLLRMKGRAGATSRSAVPGAMLLPAVVLALGLFLSTGTALAVEKKPARMWDDLCDLKVEAFQIEEPEFPPYDCWLQQFYYIPCPTCSWFWAYSGWKPGDIIGAELTIGDHPTGTGNICDPYLCWGVDGIQVLDLAGYGTVYPGMFTVEMDLYYCDNTGTPSCYLWNSGPMETHFGWNYFSTWPTGVELDDCPDFCPPWQEDCPYPTIAVTMTMTGADGTYPAVGFDNVSMPMEQGCSIHEVGCLPAVYTRGGPSGVEPRVRSGYVGSYPFEHWPPRPFPDGKHASLPSGAEWYGYVETAWRVYLLCTGPSLAPPQTQTATWGAIKSLYR